jgi:Uma2 family endonuclease
LFQQIESLEEYVLVSQDERRIEVRRRDGRGWTTEVAGPDAGRSPLPVPG